MGRAGPQIFIKAERLGVISTAAPVRGTNGANHNGGGGAQKRGQKNPPKQQSNEIGANHLHPWLGCDSLEFTCQPKGGLLGLRIKYKGRLGSKYFDPT